MIYSREEIIHNLIETELFERYSYVTVDYISLEFLRLIGTDYLLYVSPLYWGNDTLQKKWRKLNAEKLLDSESFDVIFESLPEDIQMRLVFHLDLFR